MLNLSNLSLSWSQEHKLLDNFSLSIKEGEIAVLQGPSGCGKTSLLNAIAGTAPANLELSGEIYLQGRLLNPLPPEQRKVGILFQEALLFPHLNVADNLAFGLPAHVGRQARITHVKDALIQAEMVGYEEADPAILSGGQKARIAMMRAMLSMPDLLLMDESFAALDPKLRLQFGKFVATQIEQRQIAALLISHHKDDQKFATGPVVNWPNQLI